MIPIKPTFLRILTAQCEGIINIPSLDFLKTSLFCKGDTAPQLVTTYNVADGSSLTALKFNNLDSSPGTRMYIVSNGDNTIRQYDLVNPFDVSQSNVTLIAGTFVTNDESVPTGMAWSEDGKNLFIVGDVQADVFQYNVPGATSYDLAGVNAAKETNFLDTNMGTPTGLVFNNDGSKLYVSGTLPNQLVRQFTLGTDYSVQGVNSTDGSFITTPQVTNARSVEFSTNGKKMFLLDRDSDKLFQYSVENAFDITTGTVEITNEFDLAPFSINNPLGLAFSNDGLQMFILDSNSKKVFQFKLSSPHQI